MKRVPTKDNLFRVFTKSNPKATKVLFYLTSYAFPWWVYYLPIFRFRRRGYEVVVYDFHDAIIENDNPHVLPSTSLALIEDIHDRRQAYEAGGIKVFDGIGNSLGSYLIFNYALRYPLDAMVLNGGGSISDVIFHNTAGSWKEIATIYAEKGYDQRKLRELWADFDLPSLGRNIKAEKVLITYSLKDGTIPRSSSEGFVREMKLSGKQIVTKTDNFPHILSVINNSLKVKSLDRFLNSGLRT